MSRRGKSIWLCTRKPPKSCYTLNHPQPKAPTLLMSYKAFDGLITFPNAEPEASARQFLPIGFCRHWQYPVLAPSAFTHIPARLYDLSQAATPPVSARHRPSSSRSFLLHEFQRSRLRIAVKRAKVHRKAGQKPFNEPGIRCYFDVAFGI